jgi:hypothetical protein
VDGSWHSDAVQFAVSASAMSACMCACVKSTVALTDKSGVCPGAAMYLGTGHVTPVKGVKALNQLHVAVYINQRRACAGCIGCVAGVCAHIHETYSACMHALKGAV